MGALDFIVSSVPTSDDGNDSSIGRLKLVHEAFVESGKGSIQTGVMPVILVVPFSTAKRPDMTTYEALSLATQAWLALIAMLGLIFAAYEAGKRRK